MNDVTAVDLMMEFAERTGLTSDEPPRRYLWTDAFAVCNFLGLADQRGEARFVELARRLVDQVHHTLGRHRADDSREGWLSGLGEEEGEAHPTRGGLRIGKPMPERRAGEPLNREKEWDRDGQYFHYLSKWMYALDLMAHVTGEAVYNRWARELAQTACDAFTHTPKGGAKPRMYWKMSIDLSRPQVASMGHHDPLDGYVVCLQLEHSAAARADGADLEGPSLDDEIEVFRSMVHGRDWTTFDPLGLGGLLMDAHRLYRLIDQGGAADEELLQEMLRATRRGLARYANGQPLEQPPQRRLAFRELGLAIGLYGIEDLADSVREDAESFAAHSAVATQVGDLESYVSMRDKIASFWQRDAHRQVESWTGHRDINEVMLASALAPRGCISLLDAGAPAPEEGAGTTGPGLRA